MEQSAPPGGHYLRQGPPIWLPLLILIGLSAVFRFSQLDLELEHWFWSPADGWWLANHPLVLFLYHYGVWPALIVGVGGGLFWIASRLKRLAWQRTPALGVFLALLLLLGPGVVINGIFKEHFSRSRPVQICEFGGNQPYRRLGERGPQDGGKSFPSGHAAMGFYWLGLFVYFKDHRRTLAWGFATLGLLHGLLMGLGMAQGGHWPSDILWSAGFVYLIAWVLNYLLARNRSTFSARSGLTPSPAT